MKPMEKNRLDNTPNARKLLDSLRYLGYDHLYAISDLVDNAIDAQAQHIRITTRRAPNADLILQIADSGLGMNEDILDQASRLGSEIPRNPAIDLGRFGMGLVTASLSLGRRLTIITRARKGELLVNITDIDHMIEENRFVREYFGLAREAEKKIFAEALNDAPSGTIVQISKSDGLKRRYNLKSFEKELTQHLGQVYRMFIRAGREFYIGEQKVPINDPLWLDDGKNEPYSDETYDLNFGPEGEEQTETVRIRLVVLPDHGSTQLNKKHGYNVQRSGFYVLRNNREIAAAQLLGLNSLSRHPDFIRFRGEIFISGRMDEAMGIEFTKRDVKPTQSIRDQLDALVGGDIVSIRKQLKKKAASGESKEVDYAASERLIDSKSALLIKPPPQPEPEPETQKPEGREPSKIAPGAVQFSVGHFEREGPVYAAEQRGRTIFVEWNADHPFYEKVILANRDHRDVINVVNAMVFSMAAAELRLFTDEDARELFESWKTDLSSNLRILLS
jgi:Histidine kinase-, DNA gyrase B-, and HSP90-like ATPase